MLLLILAVLWGIVLIPPALQRRAERNRVRSVDRFRRRLQVLAPPGTPPAAPVASRPADAARPFGASRSHVALVVAPLAVPLPVAERPAEPVPAPAPAVRPTRAVLLRRRRRLLGGLAAAAAVTLVAALISGAALAWAAHVAGDVALAGYVAGLRRLRRLAEERAAKVRYLPVAEPAQSVPPVEAPARRSVRV